MKEAGKPMTIDGLAEYLKGHDRYVVLSHDGPDADGIGAAYALALALTALGKTAVPAAGGKLSPKYGFIDRRGLFLDLEASGAGRLPFLAGEATAIVVDTHDPDYLGRESAAIARASAAVLVIDHHEPRREVGELTLLDPSASSSCELVFLVARSLGVELPADAAEAIFAGIVYDTGSFSYPKTGERTFECALELVRGGVVPYEIHKLMYESSSEGVLLLQKAVMSSLELRLQGRVAVQSLDKKTLAASGASYEDAEDLVNIPLQDGKVEVSVLFKENLEGRLRCSLRSKGVVNVARVAQAFGGGGHKTAAGFTCALPLAAAKDDVLQSIAKTLQR
jgi:bifunctional oligoribonuclease and PAP phosphatase NrnA